MVFPVSSASLTFDAVIAGAQVPAQILGAGVGLVEHLVRDADLALLLAGTARVGKRQNVGIATDVTIVTLHAASRRHAAVLGDAHHDRLVGCTLRPESLPLAELMHDCNEKEGGWKVSMRSAKGYIHVYSLFQVTLE